jgi:ABC-type branched-subunit amino acid transport system ATPase component
MLEVGNLSVFYGKHQALAEVALNVSRGEIVTILGGNGDAKKIANGPPATALADRDVIRAYLGEADA